MGTGRWKHGDRAKEHLADVDLTTDVVGLADDELVGLATRGNAPAFAELYRRHLALTWRVARATTLSDDDATGAVVDAFSAVFDADPRGATSLRSFFASLARDSALERLSRRSPRGSETVGLVDDHPSGGFHELPDDAIEVETLYRHLPTAIPGPPPELWALVQVAWNDRISHERQNPPLARRVVDQLPSEVSWHRG